MKHKLLQEIVEDIAHTQLPDGTWELDDTRAPEFFNLVSPYIQKAARISDIYDPEDAVGEILEGLWKSLQRHGHSYHGKPFHVMLKMKTNNVLTNRFKRRTALKNKLNYTSESLDNIKYEDAEGNMCGSLREPRSEFLNLVEVRDSLSKKQKVELTKIIADHSENGEDMPHKLLPEDLLLYFKKLCDSDKRLFFQEIFSLMSGLKGKRVKEIFCLFTASAADTPIINYSKPRLRVDVAMEYINILGVVPTGDEDMEKYVKIGTASIGEQFLTPMLKKIEVVKNSGDSVKIKIMPYDDVISVPAEYMVIPLAYAEEHPQELQPLFASAPLVADQGDVAEDDDNEEETEEDEEEETEEEETEEDEEEEETEEDEEEEEKPQNTPKNTVSKGKGKKMTKTRAKTAIAHVVKLLKSGPKTSDELAQALLDEGLTKSDTLVKAKNFVSVMIHNIKSSGKYNLIVLKRGQWEIK